MKRVMALSVAALLGRAGRMGPCKLRTPAPASTWKRRRSNVSCTGAGCVVTVSENTDGSGVYIFDANGNTPAQRM